ncbi:red chlorophyll catabolite reductase [Nostoc sp. UCD121]|uniref:red chlorophyll catabolite reductase n=1 Tax=unclassified Nostoc TaxID=2593658 RepID=UPI001625A0F2|nr:MULTISPECIES: red chlorophyll catabolite reductase [unclassified Nostoc]MBC1220417.1 red chlorophyll catabolite reductase [Nostoc sp. UCD120]MBC1274897.1 red chlorophyll catabolite reductase [Nostoc sp. UCD121]MBC1299364.1 red chlorophyll catabolite reductase [Nostoc sp. UCD122]
MTQQPSDLDNKAVFEKLWGITKELHQKLEASFQLHPDPSVEDLQQYSSLDGNMKGSLTAFSGEEIDWLVHSWLGNPEKSNFTTMRLTTWLKSHIQVPHLAFEFGTLPNGNILFYIDYIARTELLTDLAYLDRYYEPVNQTFLKLQDDWRLKAFTSKSAYIRLFQSPASLCYTSAPTLETLELIRTLAHETLERWLTWVNIAEPLPEDARIALAARDLLVRRTSAERDPGNKFVAQMFGSELADKLVRSLWGGLGSRHC